MRLPRSSGFTVQRREFEPRLGFLARRERQRSHGEERLPHLDFPLRAPDALAPRVAYHRPAHARGPRVAHVGGHGEAPGESRAVRVVPARAFARRDDASELGVLQNLL